MKRTQHAALTALVAALLATGVFAQTNFLSTQLRPVEEAEKLRTKILAGHADKVTFSPEDYGPFATRLQAEMAANKGLVDVAGGLDADLAALNSAGVFADLDVTLTNLLTSREFSQSAIELGRLGSNHLRFIPWMQNTFQMTANKKALQYLPAGANINALTYAQLAAWAKAMKDATGGPKLGFPAGPRGLMHRFFQGYLYPSYTAGVVRTYKNADAEKMWGEFKDLWAQVHPRSTTYGAMEEPLKTEEVWVAFDHTARLLPALNDKPNDFVTFPAPAGPKGRGFMPVIAGLAVPKTAPDKAAAERLIDHLTKPSTQLTTLKEVGFFPVVKTNAAELSPGVALAQAGVNATFAARDGRASLIPVGLGAKAGEFNKFFLDTFQRIIVRNEDIKAVLADEGKKMDAFMKDNKAGCWAPDATSSGGACPVQ